MNAEILQALKNASTKRFWGMIQIDFQAGKPVLLRVSETLKLEENNHTYESRPIPRQ